MNVLNSGEVKKIVVIAILVFLFFGFAIPFIYWLPFAEYIPPYLSTQPFWNVISENAIFIVSVLAFAIVVVKLIW